MTLCALYLYVSMSLMEHFTLPDTTEEHAGFKVHLVLDYNT